jgi:hypothetical protein
VQLVQIVDHHDDGVTAVGQLREDPVDHGLPAEVRRRGHRFGQADRADRLADRAQEGKPELLAVSLVASHRHEGEPMRLAWTVCPGT